MRSIFLSILHIFSGACIIFLLIGCAHDLEAKYGGAELGYSLVRDCPSSQLVLGMRFPAVKDKFEQALSESIVDALDHTGCFSKIIQNYNPNQSADLILESKINTIYSDDVAQNWATQWPGVIIFSTWWNGLIYYVDIDTSAIISNVRTVKKIELHSKDRYVIHYASNGRGVFSGSIVGWFVLTGVAFLSALVPTNWDDNMKSDVNLKIREEYGKIIAVKIIQALNDKK